MRATRSQTSAAGCFSSWPRTKAANASIFASAGPKVRSKYVESDSESDTVSDFEPESDDDVIVSKSQSTDQRGRYVREDEVTVDSKAASLFKKKIPIEVHQLIASFLSSDQDVFNYNLICKATANAITESVWRERSIRTFDVVNGRKVGDIVLKYAFRQDISRQWTCFDLHKYGGAIDRNTRQAQIANARHCVQMIKGLILESDAKRVRDEDDNLVVRGKNLQYICDMISGNGKSYLDILDAVLLSSFDETYMDVCGDGSFLFAHTTTMINPETLLLYTVQVCLAALSLSPKYCNNKTAHFDLSQYCVYAMEHSCPIFDGQHKEIVNIRWVLQAVNFFKYHLKAGGEGLLAHAYKDLPKDQYPQLWTGKLQGGTTPLGKNWKGAHTYMDPADLKNLRLMHRYKSEHKIYQDALDGGETFSDISVFFDETQYSASDWPKNWEEILESDTFKNLQSPRKRRNSPVSYNRPEIKHFWGSSRGTKTGHFFGALHSVEEQQGIPGFQRIVLMKFYTKLDENREEVFDPEQVWAYQGCVLPGGSIIVGQWWAAKATLSEFRQGGPFIWWNVERSDADIPIKKEDAFKFLDSIQIESIVADDW